MYTLVKNLLLPVAESSWKKQVEKRRGGVEDTRLEAKAKAKDPKKIRGQGQGQGQPFRGQTLSRPRTGMLEAKAKDQGPKPQVFSTKKVFKIFFRHSPIYRRSQNFWLGRPKPQITRNDVIKICLLALNQVLQMERASTDIVEKCKYVTLETFWENQCNSNVSQRGVWGQSPQLLGDFL